MSVRLDPPSQLRNNTFTPGGVHTDLSFFSYITETVLNVLFSQPIFQTDRWEKQILEIDHIKKMENKTLFIAARRSLFESNDKAAIQKAFLELPESYWKQATSIFNPSQKNNPSASNCKETWQTSIFPDLEQDYLWSCQHKKCTPLLKTFDDLVLTPLLSTLGEMLNALLDEKKKSILQQIPRFKIPTNLLEKTKAIPVCEFAIKQTMHRNLNWKITMLPINEEKKTICLNQTKFLSEYQNALNSNQLGSIIKKFKQQNSLFLSCSDYLMLLFLSTKLVEPPQARKCFLDGIHHVNDFLKKALPVTSPEESANILTIVSEINSIYELPFLKKAQKVTAQSEILIGDILIFCDKNASENSYIHMVLSIGQGYTIGLWRFPLNPDTGEDLSGPAILPIEEMIRLCAMDFDLSKEEIIVKKVSYKNLLKALTETST